VSTYVLYWSSVRFELSTLALQAPCSIRETLFLPSFLCQQMTPLQMYLVIPSNMNMGKLFLLQTEPSESIQTSWLFPHFVELQPYSTMDKLNKNISAMYTQCSITTKWKQVFTHFCKCIKIKNKQKYLIYISIQTLCYETRNWAQVHPVSIDHPWDVSTTWLESNCGKFNWLYMIWKGTHLSI
jgi:hypothetical protein